MTKCKTKTTWILTCSTNNDFLCFFHFSIPTNQQWQIDRYEIDFLHWLHPREEEKKAAILLKISEDINQESFGKRRRKPFPTEEEEKRQLWSVTLNRHVNLVCCYSLSLSIDDECISSVDIIQCRYANTQLSQPTPHLLKQLLTSSDSALSAEDGNSLHSFIFICKEIENETNRKISYSQTMTTRRRRREREEEKKGVDERCPSSIWSVYQKKTFSNWSKKDKSGFFRWKRESRKSFCKCLFSLRLSRLFVIYPSMNFSSSNVRLFKEVKKKKRLKENEFFREKKSIASTWDIWNNLQIKSFIHFN